MGFASRNRLTGKVGGWSRHDVPPHDPDVEDIVTCDLEEWKTMTAPSHTEVAISRLVAEYDRRRAETVYAVPGGPSVTLLPGTEEGLLKMSQVAARLVANGQGDKQLWIDDGPSGDTPVNLTAQQIVDHAGAYTDAIAEIEVWVAVKKAEIESSSNPMAVEL